MSRIALAYLHVLGGKMRPDPKDEDAEIMQEANNRDDKVGVDGPGVQMELLDPARFQRGLSEAPVERKDLLRFAQVDKLKEVHERDVHGRAEGAHKKVDKV
jgi:hypothetical protein